MNTYEKRQIGFMYKYQLFCEVCNELFLSDTIRKTCCQEHSDILKQLNKGFKCGQD